MKICEVKTCHTPVFGSDKITGIGYCKTHQYKRTDRDKRSIIQKAMDKSKGTHINAATHIEDLEIWFNDRRKEMTGFCKHCGGTSCRDSDKYFKFSIAHILPKSYFSSVATHPDNWVELCFWGNNCHGNLDNTILSLSELNCWDEIVTKFQRIYPSIAKHEKRRIPEILLQYIEIDI